MIRGPLLGAVLIDERQPPRNPARLDTPAPLARGRLGDRLPVAADLLSIARLRPMVSESVTAGTRRGPPRQNPDMPKERGRTPRPGSQAVNSGLTRARALLCAYNLVIELDRPLSRAGTDSG